jgi:hypothetical protein
LKKSKATSKLRELMAEFPELPVEFIVDEDVGGDYPYTFAEAFRVEKSAIHTYGEKFYTESEDVLEEIEDNLYDEEGLRHDSEEELAEKAIRIFETEVESHDAILVWLSY